MKRPLLEQSTTPPKRGMANPSGQGTQALLQQAAQSLNQRRLCALGMRVLIPSTLQGVVFEKLHHEHDLLEQIVSDNGPLPLTHCSKACSTVYSLLSKASPDQSLMPAEVLAGILSSVRDVMYVKGDLGSNQQAEKGKCTLTWYRVSVWDGVCILWAIIWRWQ